MQIVGLMWPLALAAPGWPWLLESEIGGAPEPSAQSLTDLWFLIISGVLMGWGSCGPWLWLLLAGAGAELRVNMRSMWMSTSPLCGRLANFYTVPCTGRQKLASRLVPVQYYM